MVLFRVLEYGDRIIEEEDAEDDHAGINAFK